MPIYEYRCSKCGKTFEKIQKFVDPPVEVHEECGGPVERLISTSALQFKGSGFYITDYAKGSSKPGESKSEHSSHSEHSGDSKSDSKGESKSESKSDGKGESKSESKSDSKSESGSGSKSSESQSSKSSGSGDSKSSESHGSKSPAPASKTD